MILSEYKTYSAPCASSYVGDSVLRGFVWADVWGYQGTELLSREEVLVVQSMYVGFNGVYMKRISTLQYLERPCQKGKCHSSTPWTLFQQVMFLCLDVGEDAIDVQKLCIVIQWMGNCRQCLDPIRQ